MYSKKGKDHFRWKGGRYKRLGYWYIKKPHCVFTNKDGYVREHRYIMYIYLSILNGKIIYIPKDMDVHHIDGSRDNNLISNLQILPRRIHQRITIKGRQLKKKDMSKRFCLICKSKETYIRKTKRPQWHKYKDGFICDLCYSKVYYYTRKKFYNKVENPLYLKLELM